MPQSPFPQLADGLLVSPQISRQDILAAAAAGIQTIICNRPDGEEPGQPSFEQIRHWAAEAGIRHVIHQPMLMPQIDTAAARTFAEHLASHPAPALAYCRSGTRSSLLWAMGQAARGATPQQLVQTAAAAGIDLTAALPRLLEAQP
ncbi:MULTISPECIES: TIGR01244 family sulfur transferase [Eikenella]|uniref:TIGR01244 family protein n=1 Tax=Eikenella longinqua TaxID=1795827 RepID=A0A1A9RYJ4_9NEIS|nr:MULTISPECIES: TIGR01244 family sulfur transferase [Eikenella]OAM29327.1 TIGR01244 family protein [Eikenella longinqua]